MTAEDHAAGNLTIVEAGLLNVRDGWTALGEAAGTARGSLSNVLSWLAGDQALQPLGAFKQRMNEDITGSIQEAADRANKVFSNEGIWGIALSTFAGLAEIRLGTALGLFGEFQKGVAGSIRIVSGLLTGDFNNVVVGFAQLVEASVNALAWAVEGIVKTALQSAQGLVAAIGSAMASLAKVEIPYTLPKLKFTEVEANTPFGTARFEFPTGLDWSNTRKFRPFAGLGRPEVTGLQGAPGSGAVGLIQSAAAGLDDLISSFTVGRADFGQRAVEERNLRERLAALGFTDRPELAGYSPFQLGALQQAGIARIGEGVIGGLLSGLPSNRRHLGGPARPEPTAPTGPGGRPPGVYSQQPAYQHWRSNAPVININVEGSLVAESDLSDRLDRQISDRLRAAGITIGGT